MRLLSRLVPLLAPEPLPDGRVALGVLGFYRREPIPFSRTERRLIAEFAGVVTFGLHQAELRLAAAEDSARLQVGVELALDLGASLDPVPVVRRLLERFDVTSAVQVPLGDRLPESQTCVSLVVVWVTGSVLVQVIDCPAEMVIVAGMNANLLMLTATVWSCGATATGAGGSGAGFG